MRYCVLTFQTLIKREYTTRRKISNENKTEKNRKTNLNDFLSKLQLRAERAFIEQENSHELTEEYIILFQGITKAVDQCRRIGWDLELLKV